MVLELILSIRRPLVTILPRRELDVCFLIDGCKFLPDYRSQPRIDLVAPAVSSQFQGNLGCGSRTQERIKDRFTIIAVQPHQATWNLFRKRGNALLQPLSERKNISDIPHREIPVFSI